MKTYDKCPKCDKDNSKRWIRGVTKKQYFAVICNECSNLYYQRYTDQEANDRGIKLDQHEPVPSIDMANTLILLGNESPLPAKPGKRTTSQARIN